MKKVKSVWTVMLIIGGIYIFYNLRKSYKENYETYYKQEIKGKIDSIYYGKQSQIIVRIKSKEYDLTFFNIRKGEDVNKGDSLFKGEKNKVLELHSITSSKKYLFTKEFQMNDY
ncbi:hypothetical protein [Tenacibaculum holothuriorum]|nr:hypothetical protein [Tenacibaculum holothuriorum]